MLNKQQADKIRKTIKPYCITDGKSFRLKDFDPADTGNFKKNDKAWIKEQLDLGIETMRELQERLYADDKWGVLLIFQAMDAAGKDGAIKHVFSGVNPQGCHVTSFKTPSAEELDHDYLWRCSKNLPERGQIGIFNRSYYEEVLVVKVHPAFLGAQKLPFIPDDIWKKRYHDISQWEKYLHNNGILIRKFFLHLSKEEQKKRFLGRLDREEKNWKFSASDVRERQHWDKYMEAYEEMIRNTATEYAPWYVVPADSKWFTRAVVAYAVIDALESLNLQFPKIDGAKLEDLRTAREVLMSE
ncbi:MAG: polyphosphate kinase 2 family protein [Bacteroidales bacterium]|nr:polyphosphate kinase 2 family protein [Bacteroidales bacterium]